MKFSPNTEQDFEIDGHNLHFYFYDFNPENPCLMMLHGLRSDTARMLPIINLIKHRYNVISLDLPGFGKSGLFDSEGKFVNDNYIEICSKLLKEILHTLELQEKDVVAVGISNGANIIVDYLHKNDVEFRKIVLFAPIYSNKYLSMSPVFRRFVKFLTKQTTENRAGGRLFQRIISSDKLFNTFAKTIDKKSRHDESILNYERSQWRLMTIQHWGRTLKDFLTTDYTTSERVFPNRNVIFIYPHHDQYLDVEKTVGKFQLMFPNSEVVYYNSQEHIPRGDFMEDKEAGESIRNLVQNI